MRLTVSLRLTILYGAAFLISGALLLALTYTLVVHLPSGLDIDAPTEPDLSGDLPSPTAPAVEIELESRLEMQRAEDLRQLLAASGIALVVMTLASAGLGWFMANRALKPLRSISAAVKSISERNLHQRLRMDGARDEITDLANTFDGLLGRLEDAFEAQRRFVANASHELRTPLTLERSLLEVALADPEVTLDELRGTCRRVIASNQGQERLIEALLTLARSQRGLDRRAGMDLADLVCDHLDATVSDAAGRDVNLEADLHSAPVSGDRPLIARMVANLVDNAVKHNRSGGWVKVWTGIDAGAPTLRVVNSGPVVEPEQVAVLLEPFQKLDDAPAAGFGLGLSIVAAIARAHDADMQVEPMAAGGLRIAIRFTRRAWDSA